MIHILIPTGLIVKVLDVSVVESCGDTFYTYVMFNRDDTERLRLEIAERLRTLRKAVGKTQECVADEAGISPEHLSKIETARRLPSVEVLLDLAHALDTEPAVLLGHRPVADLLQRAQRISTMLSALDEGDAAFVESEVATWVAQIRKMREKDS